MLAPHVSNNYFGGILGRSSLRLQLGTQGGEQRAAEQQRAPQSFKSASCLSRMISSPTTTRERERLQGGIGAARHERETARHEFRSCLAAVPFLQLASPRGSP